VLCRSFERNPSDGCAALRDVEHDATFNGLEGQIASEMGGIDKVLAMLHTTSASLTFGQMIE